MTLRSVPLLLLLVAAFALPGTTTHTKAEEGYTLRIASLAPAGSSWMKVLNAWNTTLQEKTNGRLKIRFYPGGSQGDEADVALADVTYLPTITNPDKILCVGLNYKAHQEETGRGGEGVPTIFVRFAACERGKTPAFAATVEEIRGDILADTGEKDGAAKAYELALASDSITSGTRASSTSSESASSTSAK